MELLPVFAASFAAGICASLGLGGGTVLILYLTAAEGLSQQTAQGINLVFFLPCAVIALIFYRQKGLVDLRRLVLPLVTGAAGALTGAMISTVVDATLMRKAFGAFLLLMGMLSLRRCQSRLTAPAEKTFSYGGSQGSSQG